MGYMRKTRAGEYILIVKVSTETFVNSRPNLPNYTLNLTVNISRLGPF